MPRRMRGLLTPVSVSVIGFVGGIPPCGAAYFAPGGKAGKAPPGDAPGGTTAPHAFRLSPAVRFPPDPRYGRRGPLAWRPCPARVEDDTYPPVCAAAAGVLNWRAYPTRVSRLPWQNRGGRWETSGRAKRARRFPRAALVFSRGGSCPHPFSSEGCPKGVPPRRTEPLWDRDGGRKTPHPSRHMP